MSRYIRGFDELSLDDVPLVGGKNASLGEIRRALAPAGRHAAICGQAPSDYPEVAASLVGLGIDALSLNPDSVLEATLSVLEHERRGAGA